MSDMKSEIVRVVSEFVVVDQGEAVDVNMTNDEEMGTIYSVSIPVKRIKPNALPAPAVRMRVMRVGAVLRVLAGTKRGLTRVCARVCPHEQSEDESSLPADADAVPEEEEAEI
jgi:hypothetical protein